MSEIKTLYTDKALTEALYPRTKFNAVSDDNGNVLGNIGTLNIKDVASGLDAIEIKGGGVKVDLLWTNPSPESAFDAQTINLELNKYDIIAVTSRRAYDTTSNNVSTNFFIKNVGEICTCMVPEHVAGYFTARAFTVNENSLTFMNGTNSYSPSGTSNVNCIPIRIYGIKTTYLLPSEPMGIFYEEIE